MHIHKPNGFTLIELSIVLIIIGLIIGGILVGETLIRGSQLRSVIKEAAQYTQAVNNFRDKYQALPGDFAGATALWGDVNACPAGVSTCTSNGDGDGRITDYSNSATEVEQFLAWQHLANAHMIDGNYTGVHGTRGARDRIAGTNVPASQLSGAGWGIICVSAADINNGYPDLPYAAGDMPPNHVLWLGGISISPTTNDRQDTLLTADEALEIDKKIDDGLPWTGKVIGQINSPACDTGSNEYNTDATNPVCNLVFKTGF